MSKNNRKIEEIDEAAMLQSIYERDNGISNIQLGEQEKHALQDRKQFALYKASTEKNLLLFHKLLKLLFRQSIFLS
jgi:hypothetical protein